MWKSLVQQTTFMLAQALVASDRERRRIEWAKAIYS